MEKSAGILHSSDPHSQIKLNLDHEIDFVPKPRSRRNYGVTIRYYDDGREQVSKRLDYQIHLRIEQFKNEHKTWQLCFDKVELFIDQHEPDLVSEQLASMAMAALYPVKVDVNSKNEIFRGIVNHGALLERWKQTSEKISDKYEGEYAALYLKKMDSKMNDRFELESALKLDMFWNVFFHPQYRKYSTDLSQEHLFMFPVVAYKNIAFEGMQSVSPTYTDYGTFKVAFRSEMDLSEDQRVYMRVNETFKMNLNAFWDLDKDGGLLKHAGVDWSLNEKTTNGVLSKKRIVFSAYEIENNQAAVNDNLLLQADKERSLEEKKKGFWARILS